MFDIIAWIVIILLMIIGMAGAFLPIIPGVLAVIAGFVAYGLFYSFEPFGFWFWLIQIIITAAILLSDYMISVLGVKAFGGSKLSMSLSIVGVIVGPFVIPVAGLIIGPFIGGMLGDWIDKKDWRLAFKAGIGAVVGLFSSAIAQILLQLLMIIVFIIWL